MVVNSTIVTAATTKINCFCISTKICVQNCQTVFTAVFVYYLLQDATTLTERNEIEIQHNWTGKTKTRKVGVATARLRRLVPSSGILCCATSTRAQFFSRMNVSPLPLQLLCNTLKGHRSPECPSTILQGRSRFWSTNTWNKPSERKTTTYCIAAHSHYVIS